MPFSITRLEILRLLAQASTLRRSRKASILERVNTLIRDRSALRCSRPVCSFPYRRGYRPFDDGGKRPNGGSLAGVPSRAAWLSRDDRRKD